MMVDWMIIFMLLVSGGKTELLDYIPTDAYWENRGIKKTAESMLDILKTASSRPVGDVAAMIKDLGSNDVKIRDQAQKKLIAMGPAVVADIKPLLKSDDAEVAARADAIIKDIKTSTGSLPLNRLMAIRTLGEMKSQDALPSLEKLMDSKDLFVADYARNAIARINGKAVAAFKPDPQKLAGDVMLLPKNCGVAGQIATLSFSSEPLEKLLEGMIPPNEDKDQIIQEATKSLLGLADKIGNVRLDAITVGVAEDIGNKKGFVILIARGLYDAEAVKAALVEAGMKTEKINDVDAVKGGGEFAFLMPSNELLVMVISPAARKQENNPVFGDLATAFKAGKGTLAENADMLKLVKSIEGSPAIWAVMKVSEAYRESELFTPFETLTLTGRQKGDDVNFVLVAQGTKAEEIKAAVDYFNENLVKAQKEAADSAQEMPMFKSLADFFATIKTETSDSGKKVTVTGQMKKNSPLSVLGILFFGR